MAARRRGASISGDGSANRLVLLLLDFSGCEFATCVTTRGDKSSMTAAFDGFAAGHVTQDHKLQQETHSTVPPTFIEWISLFLILSFMSGSTFSMCSALKCHDALVAVQHATQLDVAYTPSLDSVSIALPITPVHLETICRFKLPTNRAVSTLSLFHAANFRTACLRNIRRSQI